MLKNTVTYLLFAFFLQCAVAQKPDTTVLLDGTFKGWKILNGTADYRFEKTAAGWEIVGIATLNTPNTFLATEQEYDDFILDLEVLVDSSLNSGIQIRSQSLPEYHNGQVHGYQVEIDPSPRAWSGGIYDEGRRGWLYPLKDDPAAQKAFRNGAWNHYHIEAIGNNIRTWVNGIPCANLTDDMTTRGFIALQVHSIGDPALAGKTVRWRNILLQTGAIERK